MDKKTKLKLIIKKALISVGISSIITIIITTILYFVFQSYINEYEHTSFATDNGMPLIQSYVASQISLQIPTIFIIILNLAQVVIVGIVKIIGLIRYKSDFRGLFKTILLAAGLILGILVLFPHSNSPLYLIISSVDWLYKALTWLLILILFVISVVPFFFLGLIQLWAEKASDKTVRLVIIIPIALGIIFWLMGLL